MRLGVISDVHANLPALESALEALRAAGVDQVLCLGDLVGYGPHPRQVVRKIMQEGVLAVLGGADARIAYRLPLPSRGGVADQTLEWTLTQLTPKEIEFLRSLPPMRKFLTAYGRARAFHGAPGDPDGRLDLSAPTRELLTLLEELRARVVLVGGSHVPFYREVHGLHVIDPGSVGMTLGGEPGADVVVLETRSDGVTVSPQKVDYDLGQTLFDIQAWDLPEIVAEVVRTGRSPQRL